jgi:hypothetical protein
MHAKEDSMLYEIFALGTIWFFALLIVSNIALLAWIENEEPGWATVFVLGTLALLQFFGSIPIFQYVSQNPAAIALGVLGYFAAGTFWAIAKWWFFVVAQRDRYNNCKLAFLEGHNIEGDVIPDELKNDFADYVRNQCGYGFSKPMVSENKGRIYMWLTYWPWSFLWTIINDPVRKIAKAICNKISSLLQSISDKVWSGTDKDFPTKKW